MTTNSSSYRLWVDRMARFGYASKGAVYIMIGTLALLAAIGAGGEKTGSRGAVSAIARQPFGEVMLWAVGFGLFAFALWRFIQAVLDPEHEDTGVKNIVKRGAYFVSALVHVSLAAFALQIALGWGGGGDEDSSRELTAQILAQPKGHWLVALAGIVIAIAGIVQFYTAKTAKFMNCLKTKVSGEPRQWAKRVGRWGYAARGVVFGIVGWFLIRAALRSDASEAHGLGGALDELARHSYGAWLLGCVAAGLFLYGIFMLILAGYRRINA